ncbi:MAG: alpha amylase N-terminal ig-like domain-containing protein [Candidatus Eisenbacteria bacterium]|uniref:Alpha amylase N-terminal ig-like domain-containing protein n=1 Tax=Eiseniibacteriota bacterium TaxID=2212470 RepID=A0A948RUV0_UNCEI|nr:alpha amylase N-terminal ig-like domain-containing protein [Candidatus Eisenbacteria bacterium]MBU1948024.1 alpha amylase N-terminal ig-like domain-containing protein [Candidatus Eisenbacteria bacterium]MBU2690119.1 alpha amylase N-terminal ig-like domain-containing protein [Candidatus Eisenbacteria bacterium]
MAASRISRLNSGNRSLYSEWSGFFWPGKILWGFLLGAAAVALLGFAIGSSQAVDITFHYQPVNAGADVFLAGTFNNWSPTANKMTDDNGDGVFEYTMDLAPGRYEYKFVVNGTWYEDLSAGEFVDDTHGGRNSILNVGEDGIIAPPQVSPAGTITTPAGADAGAGHPVTFTYTPMVPTDNIFLAGTFNNWSPTAMRMTDADGNNVYEYTLNLEPGRYEYKFVVNGTWYEDQKAGEFADDGLGGKNSILNVGEGGVIPSAGGSMGGAMGEGSSAPAPEGVFQVAFSYTPDKTPQKVFIAGSFNDWSATSNPMADPEGDGTYSINLVLPGGTHKYKFVVDGVWLHDPKAVEQVDDGFGGRNSVIHIDESFKKIDLKKGDGKIFTDGITHSFSLSERNMISNQEVLFRARAYTGDVESVSLAWRADGEWTRVPMERLSGDTAFDYYETMLSSDQDLKPFHYAFVYVDGKTELWLGPDGFAKNGSSMAGFAFDPATVERLRIPLWVRDGVFYQIFPERFYNGDKSNDPDFKEWYYEGKTSLPRVGLFDGEYYHLVKDWYDVGGLKKSPYRSDGNPDWYSFYGGDIAGVMEKIPYLQDLGITIIYFNPVFQARSSHKYDTIDYMTVDPHFADEALFKKFVQKAHAAGIRIIIDVVFNHTGDAHWAFQDIVKNGPESKYWNWYEWKKWPLPDPRPADFRAENYYACWWNYGSLPDLNFDLSLPNPDENSVVDIEKATPNWPMINYLLESTRYWFSTLDIDGVRLDVPNEAPLWFWKLFAAEVRKAKPDSYIIAELWGDASGWISPDMVDATMNYRFFKDPVMKWIGKGEGSAAAFDRELAPGRSVYAPQSQQIMMNLIDSHDTVRFLTDAGKDIRRLMLAAVFQMTYVGTPHIYYGDEVAMEGNKDPDCRRPFYWKYAEEGRRVILRDHYQKLIKIRRNLPVLRRGSFSTILAEGQTLAYLRSDPDALILVVLNNADKMIEVSIPLGGIDRIKTGATFENLMGGGTLKMDGSILKVKVDPISGTIFKLMP